MFKFGIVFLLFGTILLFAPDLIYKYYNGALNYEAIFEKYSWLRYYISPILILIGVTLLIIWYHRKNGNILIRQVSENVVNEGKSKLDFPSFAKFFSSDSIELGTPLREKKHLESNKNIHDTVLKMKFVLERTNITSISYLGADYIPYLVEFGFLLNQCGTKIKLYHNFIKNGDSKIKKLPKGYIKNHCTNCTDLLSDNFLEGKNHKEIVFCFESSKTIDLNSLPFELSEFDKKKVSTKIINRSSITTTKEIYLIAESIANEINLLSDKYDQIHLILCCSSDLCFAIGQKLRINELKPILVYDYDNSKTDSRPWHLKLTK